MCGESLAKVLSGCVGQRSSLGFPGGSDGKESACKAEDPGSIPGLGSSPGEENGYPLQYSCLENSINRGDLCAATWGHKEWVAFVGSHGATWGHKELDTTEQISLALAFP